MRLVVVRFGVDDFRRRLPGNGVMEQILDSSKEISCSFGSFVVINAASNENICHLSPDLCFARTNGANALEQFSEIVLSEGLFTLFEPLVV